MLRDGIGHEEFQRRGEVGLCEGSGELGGNAAVSGGLMARPEAIIHTDRGSQYASNDFRKLLEARLRQSMSAKGNCYDNAQAESFFSRFKTEIDTRVFSSVEEAHNTAFDYIECYYNRVRRHTTLGMTIPEFERRLKNGEIGCGNMEKPKAAFPHSHSHDY